MDVQDERIPEERFAEHLAAMPQVCVELVVDGPEGGVLLVKRTNRPAQWEWFWPGSRLYRGEELEPAARRVAREELGIQVGVRDLLGVQSHFWTETSVEGLDDRHTVNVVYHVEPVDDDPDIELDDQHSDYRYLREPERGLHEYVQAYIEEYDLLPES
jgi:colanic acid biosynthesis protein WcaH